MQNVSKKEELHYVFNLNEVNIFMLDVSNKIKGELEKTAFFNHELFSDNENIPK